MKRRRQILGELEAWTWNPAKRGHLRAEFGHSVYHRASVAAHTNVDRQDQAACRSSARRPGITVMMRWRLSARGPCGLGSCRGRQLPRTHFWSAPVPTLAPAFHDHCEKVTSRLPCAGLELAWAGRMCHDPRRHLLLEPKRVSHEGSSAKQFRPHSASPPVERANSAHSGDRNDRRSWRAERTTILGRM